MIYVVVRIQVSAERVAGIEQPHGSNTVHVDAKPGSDQLAGIDLLYTPTANGACAAISTTLAQVRQLDGEVYEAVAAGAARELNANRDNQRAQGYAPNKSRERQPER